MPRGRAYDTGGAIDRLRDGHRAGGLWMESGPAPAGGGEILGMPAIPLPGQTEPACPSTGGPGHAPDRDAARAQAAENPGNEFVFRFHLRMVSGLRGMVVNSEIDAVRETVWPIRRCPQPSPGLRDTTPLGLVTSADRVPG